MKTYLFFILIILAYIAGYSHSNLNMLAGKKLAPGSVFKITGSCKTNSGGAVTLTNDTVRLIRESKNELEVVFTSDAKYLHCPASSVFIESFNIPDLFKEHKIQYQASKDTRDVEKDPVLDLMKKTVLANGICKLNGKLIPVIDKVFDVLNVKATQDEGIYEVYGLIKSQQMFVSCLSNFFKGKEIAEEDVANFLDKEKKDMSPVNNSFKGKTINVTGTCLKRINGKTSKSTVDMSVTPVKVTEELSQDGIVKRIYGKTKDENENLVSIECSKDYDNGLLFEEKTNDESQNLEGLQSNTDITSLIVTGKCLIKGTNIIKELSGQLSKVVSLKKDNSGLVTRAEVKIKSNDSVLNLICDKEINKVALEEK